MLAKLYSTTWQHIELSKHSNYKTLRYSPTSKRHCTKKEDGILYMARNMENHLGSSNYWSSVKVSSTVKMNSGIMKVLSVVFKRGNYKALI